MLSVVAHKNLAHAEGYFSEHLAQNDYYAVNEVQPGEWLGQGAVRLGLAGSVDQEAFLALCSNRRPDTTETLTVRQLKEGERRVFYDFTCSAPKSVSILAVTLEDNRLIEAHQEAARIAFTELERYAASRVRKSGASSDRSTGNLVAGAFLHTSSRALDPQLHTHFTVFNATWDKSERCWKALQAGEMYRAIRYGTQVYRNELAHRILALGYGVRQAKHVIEIEGVGEAVLRRFSKRAEQRDQVVQEMEQRLGRKLTKDEVSHAVHRSRARKVQGMSSTEVRSRQLAQLSADELRELSALKTGGVRVPKVDSAPALDHAMAHVFERKSVVLEHELLEAALSFRPGTVVLKELQQSLVSHPNLVRTETGYTTRAILEAELQLLLTVRDGKSAVPAMAPCVVPAEWLGKDQQAAVRHVFQSVDRVTGVRGLAGSGKTTALQEIARLAGEAGYQVQFCAPTAVATAVLRSDGLEAVTLARLLTQRQSRSPRSMIILDEAGAVGVADMNRLLRLGGRVLLVGDTGQHASVARGDALRLLEEHSPYTFGELSQIRRQRKACYRKAVELAAHRNPEAAFAALERMGAIREHRDLGKAAADRYLAAREAGRSILVVAPTWNEIDNVTGSIRRALQQRGDLAVEETTVPTFHALPWTVAQRKDRAQYRSGQWMRFHHVHEGLGRNELVEVVGVGSGGVSVRRESGEVLPLDPARAASRCEVGERRELRVASGDRLLLRANLGGFTNGELVEVDRVDASGIRLRDGRSLPSGYQSFTHGYAVTSHAAQGKTVDEVVVVASSRSLPAIHREQFYVSISRGRDHCHILTDDRAQLRRCIGRTSARVAAIEAVQVGHRRRELIQRAIRWATQLPIRLGQWIAPQHGLVRRITESQSHTQRTSIRI